MSKTKAQVAVEYIFLFLFVVGLIAVIFYFVYDAYDRYNVVVSSSKVESIARDIVLKAEEVYYFGSPSQTIYKAEMPGGVEMIRIQVNAGDCTECTELIFDLSEEDKEVVMSSRVELKVCGENEYIFPQNHSSKGAKNFVIKAFDDYVEICLND